MLNGWCIMIRAPRASILIMSIWVLVFLTILSLGLYRMVAPQLDALKEIEYRVSGLYLAKGAISSFVYELETDVTSYDTKLELSKERTLGTGALKAYYKIIDVGSRINVNVAPNDVMVRLANNDLELRAAISPSKIEGRSSFKVKEQLLLSDKVSQKFYNSIEELITVYGANVYNINNVSTGVLSVLGINTTTINKLESFRNGEDGVWGTDDDGVFESLKDITSFDRVLNKHSMFKVKSEIFNVMIKIKHYDTEVLNYDIIVNESGKILSWQER